MGKSKVEKLIVVGADCLAEYEGLSPLARRIVNFYALHADYRGVAPFSRRSTAKALAVYPRTIASALEELVDKDFVAQVGYGQVCVNPKKVDAGTGRVRAHEGILVAQYLRLKEGWAAARARKSAAGKLRRGAEDGVVAKEDDEEGGAQ